MKPEGEDSTVRVRVPARTEEQFAAFQEKLSSSDAVPTAGTGWFVALARQDQLPDDKRLASFAEAFGLDAFTARQRLLSPATRLLRREDSQSEAQAWVEWLGMMHLRAFIVPGGEAAAQQFAPQAAVYAGDGVLVFVDHAEKRLDVPTEAVAALVFGDVRERVTTEKERKSLLTDPRNLNVAGPVAAQQAVMDIHLRHGNTCLRLEQDKVQYSRMFPDQTGASAVLIRKIFSRVRKMVPHAPVFEGFREAEDVLGASLKLLGTDAVGSSIHRVFLKTSLPTFNLYSTLARLEAMQSGVIGKSEA